MGRDGNWNGASLKLLRNLSIFNLFVSLFPTPSFSPFRTIDTPDVPYEYFRMNYHFFRTIAQKLRYKLVIYWIFRPKATSKMCAHDVKVIVQQRKFWNFLYAFLVWVPVDSCEKLSPRALWSRPTNIECCTRSLKPNHFVSLCAPWAWHSPFLSGSQDYSYRVYWGIWLHRLG